VLGKVKPFIPSGPDFAAARMFFVELGFSVDWEAPGLAQLSLGEAAFILQDFHNKELQENLMMFVSVADLDGWWHHVQVSGVLGKYPDVRAKEPQVYPWGQREVHLIDPAGVCWHFA
jgi:uncharacterized glyoxalase superfamily protein PhnB